MINLFRIIQFFFIILIAFPVTILSSTIFKNPHLEILSQKYIYSDSLLEIGEFEKSNTINQSLLDSINNIFGQTSIQHAYALYKLAVCKFELGNYKATDSLLKEAQAINNLIDSTSLFAGRILYKVSVIGEKFLLGKKIIPTTHHAIDVLTNHLGYDHPEVVQGMELLGFLLINDSKYDEALSLLDSSIQILKRTFGENSPELWRSYCYKGAVYVFSYKQEDAIIYLDSSIAVLENKYGENYWELYEPYYYKSAQCLYANDFEKSEHYYNRTIKLARDRFGEDHIFVADCQTIITIILTESGKYALAEPILLETKSAYEKVFDHNDPIMNIPLNNLASLYLVQGKYEEAVKYFNQCLAIEGLKEATPSIRIANLNQVAGATMP